VRRRLLTWFRRHGRALPWRRNRDPYAIWVSEVMLQQTQVATVIPYFERFLKSFPTVAALAAADEHDVLRHWEGLGYYRRARQLHQAARRVVSDHQGRIPADPAAFGGLPGVGRYTLGAVLSQAFELRLPILEANSLRVLCRLVGCREDPRGPAAQQRLWAVAEQLLPVRHVGDFNQALMELGALVCTPAAPDCAACPLALHCSARRQNLQAKIPRKAPAVAVEEVSEVAVVVWRGGEVLLVQRPAGASRWAKMWEFPHAVTAPGEAPAAAARRVLAELTGLDAEPGAEVVTIRHGVTRFRITLLALEAAYRGGEFRSDFYTAGQWVTPARLAEFAVSSPQRRLAQKLLQPRQGRLF
jgi:A/G-specific adenine glycosylase